MAAALLFAALACDINNDGALNVLDVAITHRQILGTWPITADLDNDGRVTIVDLQRVNIAVMGGACVAVPSMPRFYWTNGGKSCVSVYITAPFKPGGSPWVATCQ